MAHPILCGTPRHPIGGRNSVSDFSSAQPDAATAIRTPKRHCKSKSACPAALCGLPFRFYRALCRKNATHCADYPAYACFLRFKQFGRRQTYAAPVRIIEYGRDAAARHRYDSTDAQAAAACFRRLRQKKTGGYACKPSTRGTSPVCSGEMDSAIEARFLPDSAARSRETAGSAAPDGLPSGR